MQTALRVAVGESGPHPAPPTPAASPQAWQPLGVTLRARARGAGGGLVTGIHTNRPAAAGPGFGNPSSLRRLRPFWQFKVTRLLRVCDFSVNSARGGGLSPAVNTWRQAVHCLPFPGPHRCKP